MASTTRETASALRLPGVVEGPAHRPEVAHQLPPQPVALRRVAQRVHAALHRNAYVHRYVRAHEERVEVIEVRPTPARRRTRAAVHVPSRERLTVAAGVPVVLRVPVRRM